MVRTVEQHLARRVAVARGPWRVRRQRQRALTVRLIILRTLLHLKACCNDFREVGGTVRRGLTRQVTISHLQTGHAGVWRLPCSPRLLAGCSLSSATLSWSDDDVYR